MNKLKLFAIITIIALCSTLLLAACDNAVYPEIEDVNDVLAEIENIKSYDCDVYFAYSVATETDILNQYESFCLRTATANDMPLRYVYSIQNSDNYFYKVGTKLFEYKDNALVVPTNTPNAEGEQTNTVLKKLDFWGILLAIEPLVGLNALSYEASYDVANQSTFTAAIASDMGILTAFGLQDDMVEVTEATLTVQASNKTSQPVSVLLALTGTSANQATAAEVSLQIKVVFKQYNKDFAFDYPQEVQAFLGTIA